MALDETKNNNAYLLGRLFSVLEKVQLDSNPSMNATIRDRYYGAASRTPAMVFGNLIKISMHHASKLSKAPRIRFDIVKSAIMDKISSIGFPRTLCLEDQGLFAIGYYHQRQSFYTKRSTDGNTNNSDEISND